MLPAPKALPVIFSNSFRHLRGKAEVFGFWGMRSRLPADGLRGSKARRILSGVAASLLCLWTGLVPAWSNVEAATLRITNDHGGNIGEYWARYMAIRDSGEQVVIDGPCASACTMVLGIIPRDRLCVTPRAVLGFHAAFRPGFLGAKVINEPATRTLMGLYPDSVQRWIARNGGLGWQTIYLSGPELLAMYPTCH